MNCYPEMNAKIVRLLREDCDNPVMLYAAARIEQLEEALRRIAAAKPDRLDHAADVAIVERAAKVAREAVAAEAETPTPTVKP